MSCSKEKPRDEMALSPKAVKRSVATTLNNEIKAVIGTIKPRFANT